MPKVSYGGRSYDCPPGASLLEGLEAHDVRIPSSCRSGACQKCLVRAVGGKVPAAAQVGLKDTQRARNYLLACRCVPTEDLEIVDDDEPASRIRAEVIEVRHLNAEMVSLRLQPAERFDYRSGQFVRLFRDDETSRCYSLASVPHLDGDIDLHVKRVSHGRVSGWIHDALRPGQELSISEATGQSFYLPGRPEQGLLLIGTGCGLGSLAGIARDALRQGHTGPIRLYHGSSRADGLYWVEELGQLAREHPNLFFLPCVSREAAPAGAEQGNALRIALSQTPELAGWRVFLCGHPDMVTRARTEAFLAGASIGAIHADPFLPS